MQSSFSRQSNASRYDKVTAIAELVCHDLPLLWQDPSSKEVHGISRESIEGIVSHTCKNRLRIAFQRVQRGSENFAPDVQRYHALSGRRAFSNVWIHAGRTHSDSCLSLVRAARSCLNQDIFLLSFVSKIQQRKAIQSVSKHSAPQKHQA